jgi:hypothetical protein
LRLLGVELRAELLFDAEDLLKGAVLHAAGRGPSGRHKKV